MKISKIEIVGLNSTIPSLHIIRVIREDGTRWIYKMSVFFENYQIKSDYKKLFLSTDMETVNLAIELYNKDLKNGINIYFKKSKKSS